MPLAQQAEGINSCPPHLLGNILALAGRSAGPSVTLVCRTWRQAYYSDSLGLWRCLDLGGTDVWQLPAGERRAALDSRCHLLARVAPLVATFSLHLHAWQQYGWVLADLLRLLHPQRRQALRLDCRGCAADGDASALLRFSMASLALSGGLAELPAGMGAALGSMRSLRSLQLSTDVVCEPAVSGILGLATCLTRLHIDAEAPIPGAAQLACLSRLRHLRLHERRPSSAGGGAPGQQQQQQQQHWARLAVLALLRDRHAPAALPPPADFPELVSYSYARDPCWGHLELGGAELRHAQLSFDSDPCGSGGAGMLWVLRVQPASSSGSTIPSLGDLLNALLPPGAPLHCLRLGGGAGLQAGAARGCRRLARLPALRLDACPSAGSEAEAGVRALLAQAATLAALRIDGSSGAEEDQGQGWIPLTDVPAWLAATQGLAALSLTCHHLATLPEGPYLSGLTSLDLSGNQLAALPPAVAAATCLRRLCLSGNQLSALPEGPYLTALHELDIAENPLPGLPPALGAASSLRRLLLAQPPAPADVHAVLSRMPALRQLVLPRGCGGAEGGALAALQAAAPRLEVLSRS